MNLSAYLNTSVTPLKNREVKRDFVKPEPIEPTKPKRKVPPTSQGLLNYRARVKEELRAKVRAATQDVFCALDMALDMDISHVRAAYICRVMFERGHTELIEQVTIGKGGRPTNIYRWK